MVAITYRRWSFTRGANCKALTGKILVFWRAVAYERWSHIEVRLYYAVKLRHNSDSKLRF